MYTKMLLYGPRNLGLDHPIIDDVVRAAMALAEIGHLGERFVHQLSFGEMKRIGLAGLIAMRQPLMLLDEPSSYLDPAAARQLVQIIKRLNEEYGYTFVVVTYDMELAAELATRVVIMQSGRSSRMAGRATFSQINRCSRALASNPQR